MSADRALSAHRWAPPSGAFTFSAGGAAPPEAPFALEPDPLPPRSAAPATGCRAPGICAGVVALHLRWRHWVADMLALFASYGRGGVEGAPPVTKHNWNGHCSFSLMLTVTAMGIGNSHPGEGSAVDYATSSNYLTTSCCPLDDSLSAPQGAGRAVRRRP